MIVLYCVDDNRLCVGGGWKSPASEAEKSPTTRRLFSKLEPEVSRAIVDRRVERARDAFGTTCASALLRSIEKVRGYRD